MRRCRAGSTSCAKASGGMRSRRFRRPRSMTRLGSCGSRRYWPTPPASGSRPNGRCARSARRPRRSAWERLSPTPGAMRSSRSSALPARTISMLPSSNTQGKDRAREAIDPEKVNGSRASLGSSSSIRKYSRPAPRPLLAAAESAVVRDRLLSHLAEFEALDPLLAWASLILPEKNALAQEDARTIEGAFEAKIAALGSAENGEPEPEIPQPAASRPRTKKQSKRASVPSRPAMPKTRRRRDKRHLEFVSSQPCLVCGRSPADAHHLRFAEHAALSRKVSDEFTVPLCRIHHRELHSRGDEKAWWAELKIEPSRVAQQLWSETLSLMRGARQGS